MYPAYPKSPPAPEPQHSGAGPRPEKIEARISLRRGILTQLEFGPCGRCQRTDKFEGIFFTPGLRLRLRFALGLRFPTSEHRQK